MFTQVMLGRELHVAPKKALPVGITTNLGYNGAREVMHKVWEIVYNNYDAARTNSKARTWDHCDYWLNSTNFEATRQIFIRQYAPQEVLEKVITEVTKVLADFPGNWRIIRHSTNLNGNRNNWISIAFFYRSPGRHYTVPVYEYRNAETGEVLTHEVYWEKYLALDKALEAKYGAPDAWLHPEDPMAKELLALRGW